MYNSNKRENDEIKNKIKELENQILNEKGTSDKLNKLFKDANNLYKISSKENDELKNKIQELENLESRLRNQKLIDDRNKDIKINNLINQNKLLESGRNYFKEQHDLTIKEINKLKNEIQELKNLKFQESLVSKLDISKLNKFSPSGLDVKSPLPTGIKFEEIKSDKDDEEQNKKQLHLLQLDLIKKQLKIK